MEARDRRRSIPDAPVTAVVVSFVVAFIVSFFLAPIRLDSAKRVAGGLAGQNEIILHFGIVLGIALIAAMVVWAGVYFIFIRRARPRWAAGLLLGLAGMMLLLTVGTTSLAGAVADRKDQERIASTELRKVIAGFLDEGARLEIRDTRPKARGEPGEIERLVKISMADIAKIARQYEADIGALKLDNLTPRELAKADLGAVQVRLRKAISLTVAYRSDLEDAQKRIKARLDASKVSPFSKRLFAQSFGTDFAATQERLDRMLDLQLELIDVTSEQLAFLDRRRGGWVVVGDSFAFRTMADVTAYNARAVEIQRIGRELESIKRGQRSRMLDLQDQLIADAAE